MTAKEYLSQIRKLDRQIENKQLEYQELEARIDSITVPTDGERVDNSSIGDRTAMLVCKLVTLGDEIQDMIGQLYQKRKEIVSVIEKLQNPTHYAVIHKRYVQYMSFDEIAEEEGYHIRSVHKIHGKALLEVKRLMEKEGIEGHY